MDLLNDFEAAAELLAAAAYFLLLAGCWFPCGGCHCVCQYCYGGRAPRQWKVVISGVVSDSPGCAFCSDWDGTYFIDVPCDSGCSVFYFFDVGCNPAFGGASFDDGVWVRVDTLLGDYFITVELRFTSATVQRSIIFSKNYGEQQPDCLSLVDEDIPYASAFIDTCDGTAATCLLTAVD